MPPVTPMGGESAGIHAIRRCRSIAHQRRDARHRGGAAAGEGRRRAKLAATWGLAHRFQRRSSPV